MKKDLSASYVSSVKNIQVSDFEGFTGFKGRFTNQEASCPAARNEPRKAVCHGRFLETKTGRKREMTGEKCIVSGDAILLGERNGPAG